MNPPDSPATEFELDTRGIRRAFERASEDYDRAAVLQKSVRHELLQRLEYVRLRPEVILDAGCGTGHAAGTLKRRFRRAHVIALDAAPGMLRQARRHQSWLSRFSLLCADTVRLPLPDASVDLIYSNLMLQWCNDLDAALGEFRRVLKPQGLLTFSTFGPDTLKELRAAWRAADDKTHVNHFIDMHDIGDAMMRAGLAEPVLDVERYTLTYGDAMALMRDLKTIGAHNVNAGRPQGLTGRRRLAAMEAGYESFRINGQLPATYEVVYGQAWGRRPPEPGNTYNSLKNEVNIPLDRVRRRSGP